MLIFLGLRAFGTGPDFFGKRSLLLVCVSSRKSRRSVFRSSPLGFAWRLFNAYYGLLLASALAFMIFLTFSTWY